MELLHQTGDIVCQKYRILTILGEGGSGTTYLARDLRNNRKVALKAMSLRNLGNWKLIELIEREARVLAQLNHPSIPRYLEYFQVDAPTDRTFYIAQQLAKGESLAALVAKGWHATEQQVRQIAVQILNVLVYLHSLDPPVIHRDIKPENIILNIPRQTSKATTSNSLLDGNWRGQLFLVDFGAVQDTYQSTLAGGSTVVGTFGYMAPEQFQGRAIPATDLYGLGATLLFLLTHRSPAELPTDRLKINFRSRVQVSEKFADWLEKMLEPDIEERFASAKEALDALQGKRQMSGKIRYISKKAIAGVSVAVVAAAFFLNAYLNSYKYAIRDALGIKPVGVYDAIERGQFEPLKDYLKHGGNPNIRGPNGIIPLHWAVENNNQEVAQLLLDRGADPNVRDPIGSTPLHWAAYYYCKEAASYNCNAVFQWFPELGTHPNMRERYSRTPSYWATRSRNNQELAPVFPRPGTHPNMRERYGRTPPYRTIRSRNNKELILLLLERGADPNMQDGYGRTPLYWAVENNNQELIQLLLERGADPNVQVRDGKTPLYWAVENSNQERIQLLLDRGADPNVKNQDGEIPLHWATRWSNKKLAQLLLECGADPNAKTQDGETSLDYAVQNGNQEMISLLKRYGAKE